MAAPDSQGFVDARPPGTRLGELEIERVIAMGGLGIVYLGFDHTLEREVAIKSRVPTSTQPSPTLRA
jgi:hypothetical protein